MNLFIWKIDENINELLYRASKAYLVCGVGDHYLKIV
jgi:hypothetical protein